MEVWGAEEKGVWAEVCAISPRTGIVGDKSVPTKEGKVAIGRCRVREEVSDASVEGSGTGGGLCKTASPVEVVS